MCVSVSGWKRRIFVMSCDSRISLMNSCDSCRDIFYDQETTAPAGYSDLHLSPKSSDHLPLSSNNH